MGIIGDAWKHLRETQHQGKLKRERELLDREVEKRKLEAFEQKISGILIMIREEGNSLAKPFLADYKYDSSELHKTVLTFVLNGKPYRIIFQQYDSSQSYSRDSKYDKEPVGLTLESNGQTIYSARIYKIRASGEYPVSWYVSSDSPYDIEAYLPGGWVREFKMLAEQVEKAKEREDFEAKHSPSALDDLKKKFGL